MRDEYARRLGDARAAKAAELEREFEARKAANVAALTREYKEALAGIGPSQFRGTPDCNESAALHSYGLDSSLSL